MPDNHINDDESSSTSDTGTAVYDDWSCLGNSTLSTVDVVEEVQNAARIRGNAVIWPSLFIRLTTFTFLKKKKISMKTCLKMILIDEPFFAVFSGNEFS